MCTIFVLMFSFGILSADETDDSDNPYVIVPTFGPTTDVYLDIPDPNINFTVLDMRIMRGLKGPAEGNGSEILEAAKRYYKELEELAETMEHSKNAGRTLLDILDLRDGPKFINMKVDRNFLRQKFKWDKAHLDEFMKNVNGTRWSLVRLNLAKNATSEELPEDETESYLYSSEPKESSY